MQTKMILGIILVLILAACAPAPQAPAEKPTVEVPPAAEPAPAVTPTPEKVEEVGRIIPTKPLPSERQETTPPAPAPVVTTQEMSPQLRDLLKRHVDKVKSFRGLYGGTLTNNLFLDTYFYQIESGQISKTKINKYEESYYVREDYYDTIYIDLGVACCEELSRCRSHNVDNTGKKFDVDASAISLPKTPIDWVKEIPAGTTIVGPQTFNQRSVTFIKFNKADGTEVRMWVDDSYGLPLKIEEEKSGNIVRHQWNDPLFNGFKATDFDAPCD